MKFSKKYEFRGVEVETMKFFTVFFVKEKQKCYPTSCFHYLQIIEGVGKEYTRLTFELVGRGGSDVAVRYSVKFKSL
jgi:hypothetical protein